VDPVVLVGARAVSVEDPRGYILRLVARWDAELAVLAATAVLVAALWAVPKIARWVWGR
jgi:hypothetical protein